MKKHFVYIGICMGMVFLTGLFLTSSNGGKINKSVAAKAKEETEHKEEESKKTKKKRGDDEIDKDIKKEARKELSELRRKKLIKNKKTASEKSKKQTNQKKEESNKADKQRKKTKDEEKDWKTKALSGMFDEEKMMEEEGKPVIKPKYTVENTEKNTEVIVQSNGKCQISVFEPKIERKKENKKNKKNKDKKKKRRLSFEDLVMTDEEEAAYWGYTLEEWNNLSDKEKFGTVEGSKANTPFGGPSIGFEFD